MSAQDVLLHGGVLYVADGNGVVSARHHFVSVEDDGALHALTGCTE